MFSISKNFSDYSHPVVPSDLIRYTCGTDSFDEFLLSGFEVAWFFDLASKKYFGKSISEFSNVLDFGCGCGRLARFIKPRGRLFGCDVNRDVTNFCNSNLLSGSYYQNDLMPPLIYRNGIFDLVYSFSVFSHLSKSIEEAWLEELLRVGQPGCLYLITIQGDWMIESTLGDNAARAQAEGFLYMKVHQRHQSENDFPDYYESSYHTSTYIKEKWSKYFDIIAVIKGDNPERYMFGEHSFLPQGSIPNLRPMGQDLVVAVKR